MASPTGSPVGGGPGGNAGNASVTFNFVRAQSNPIVVPTTTVSLRFEFFSGQDGSGTLVKSETRPFAAQVVIENVPFSARSSVVTAISAEGFPLAEFTADISVPASGNINVGATDGDLVPVTITSLASTPATVSLGNSDTLQLQIRANFSNGDVVALTGPLTSFLSFSTSNATVVTVVPNGTMTAGLDGTANINVGFTAPGFAAASLTVPVTVGAGFLPPPQVVSVELITVETQPVSLPRGTVSQPLVVQATFSDASVRVVNRADGVEFVTSNPDITVNQSNQIAIAAGADVNDVASITARFAGQSDSVQVVVSPATLDSVTVNPTAVSLPFGGFERAIVATGTFSDGSSVSLNPANLIYTESSPLFAINTTTGLVTSATAGTAGVGNLTVQVGPGFNGQPQVNVQVTVGDLFVQSLTVTPSVLTNLVPGDIQTFDVVATLSDNTMVNVTSFVSLVPTATQSSNTPPNNIAVSRSGNRPQVVAIAPTATNLDAVVTLTIPGSGQAGINVAQTVNVKVLAEVLTEVKYFFGGIEIGGPTFPGNAVNLPRGYVGVVEVEGTFTSGNKRLLRPSEYSIELENANNGKNGTAIRLWGSSTGPGTIPGGDYYVHPTTNPRYTDGIRNGRGDLGEPVDVNPLTAPIDDFYYHPRSVQDLVASGLRGSTYSGAVDEGGLPGVAVTRPTFRAVVADWRRGEAEGGFVTGPGLDPIASTPLLPIDRSGGSVRDMTIVLAPSVTGVMGPSPLNETVSVTVVDPIEVEIVTEQTRFKNYGAGPDLDIRIPVGAVREFQVVANFKEVELDDTNGANKLLPDMQAQGPFVNAITGWKLAEANTMLISATGGANPFVFTTPTSTGFVGITSNEEVDVNVIQVRAVPVGGDTLREYQIDGNDNPPRYGPITNIYGVNSEFDDEEPTGLRLVARDHATDSDPADFNFRVFDALGGNQAPVIDVIDPVLFSLDPINVGANPVGIRVGATQTFRTLVQFDSSTAFVDRSLDYPPVLFTNTAMPAAISAYEANGDLLVSGINDMGAAVTTMDVDNQSGSTLVTASADVASALAMSPEAIVVAVDSVGIPIAQKGSFSGLILDLLGQAGAAQHVTRVGIDPIP